MKNLLSTALALALLLPGLALAQDANTGMMPPPPPPGGTNGMPPPDGMQQPGTNVTPGGTMPRDVFKQGDAGTMQVRPFLGSSTNGTMPNRPPMPGGAGGMPERPAFGSS